MEPTPTKSNLEKYFTFIGVLTATYFLFYASVWLVTPKAEAFSFSPKIEGYKIELPEANQGVDYKTQRLREMAQLWEGTSLEPYTTKLLGMLMTEDGTLTAERRHDCGVIYSTRLGRTLKGCFAVGIMGHNIAARGTPLVEMEKGKPFKLYDYDYGMTDFERDYPEFSKEWREQFKEYTLRMTQCLDKGNSVNRCIQNWNPREVGRLDKVSRNERIVRVALKN